MASHAPLYMRLLNDSLYGVPKPPAGLIRLADTSPAEPAKVRPATDVRTPEPEQLTVRELRFLDDDPRRRHGWG